MNKKQIGRAVERLLDDLRLQKEGFPIDGIAMRMRLFWQWIFRPRLTGRIENQLVILDYLNIESCAFRNCILAHYGGSVSMVGCTIFDCRFGAYGKAATTLAFMHAFARLDPKIIRNTFPEAFVTPEHQNK